MVLPISQQRRRKIHNEPPHDELQWIAITSTSPTSSPSTHALRRQPNQKRGPRQRYNRHGKFAIIEQIEHGVLVIVRATDVPQSCCELQLQGANHVAERR